MNDPNKSQRLSQGNSESSPDSRLAETQLALKSWSGGGSGERSTVEADSDMVASSLISLVQDCVQQVTAAKELLWPIISEIKGSSDEITERLRRSRKQALLRKEELDAERLRVHQAASKVIIVLNDSMHGIYDS